MGKDVIIALDFGTEKEVMDFLSQFTGEKPYVKIGMELFYATGPDLVRKVKAMGHKIFLDLKLHDIPNTVKGGMRSLSKLDVDMTNLHAHGGITMMKAAIEGLTRDDGTRPLLISIATLTSISEKALKEELLVETPLNEAVVHYSKITKIAGLDGTVCSPLESKVVHEACGADFITVTPGVRYPDGDVGDQIRVTTPAMAKEIGSDYIVVGRPITRAENPVAAYERVCADFIG